MSSAICLSTLAAQRSKGVWRPARRHAFALVGRGTRRYVRRRGADEDRAVTPENQIMELLTRRRGRLFCADCIARELQWPNPKDTLAAMHAIGMAKGFRRATEACSRCGATCDGIKAG